MVKPQSFLALIGALLLSFSISGAAQTSSSQLADDQVPLNYLSTNGHPQFKAQPPNGHKNGQGHAALGVFGIDSLLNFNGHYKADGYDSNGNPQTMWYYNTVGQMPQQGGTTVINAPIVPVNVNLLNYDGSIRFHIDATQYVQMVLNSPVFQNATYSSSSTPTQFTDAVQRAEYYNSAKPDWHTILAPSVKTTRTMNIPRGTYRFATYADGSIAYILVDANTFGNLLFPTVATDTTTPVGAAENAGEVTTKDMSTFLFPNTYLYVGNPSNCCILGYHTYDYEPGNGTTKTAEKRYVLNYSSWISPGLFNGGFADVTATSHEIAETYNDPFVASDGIHDITPWWLAPNGNCQNDLETGDVIEGLNNAVYPMTMNGYTYHPQNEALLQWFEFQGSSDALDNAYSYPNETTLTALSAPQSAGCQ